MKKLLERVFNKFESMKNALFSGVHKKFPACGRIMILTSMQMRNSKRLLKPTSAKDKALVLLLKIALFVGLIYGLKMFLNLFQNLVFITIDFELLTFFLFIYAILTILEMSSSFAMTLYKGKDNSILLSYPVNAGEIFISKLLVKYIKELKKMVFFLIPLLIAFYSFKSNVFNLGTGYLFGIVLVYFTFPLFIVLFSGFLSIAFVLINYLFKRIPFSRAIVYCAISVLGFYILINLVNSLPTNLPLLDLWYDITRSAKEFIVKFIQYSFFTKFLLQVIFNNDVLISILITFASLIVLFILQIFVCFKLFFKLSSSAVEINSNKTYHTKMNQTKNTFIVFLRKELKTYIRSDDQIITTFLYLIILPLLLYCLNRIFNVLNISATGEVLIACINILISITLLTSSNISSASALSREGSEFYLLKISPADTRKICVAKMLINWILSSLSIIAVGITLSRIVFFKIDIIVFICLVLFFVNTGHICWSFELDVCNPSIAQYTSGEITAIDNKNVSKSILYGLLIAVLFTFLTYFFYTKYIDSVIQVWIRIVALAIAFCVARIVMVILKIRAYFNDISI